MVGDIRQDDLATEIQPAAYVPYAQIAWFHTMYVIARTQIDAATMVAPIRRAIRKVDANIPFDGVSTMDSRIDASLSRPRFHSFLLVIFAAMSLLIAASGIYATMLHSVRRRTREFAIRIALGARTTSVLNLVIRESMLLTGIGIAVGLLGAAALSRIIASLVFGVGGLDPLAGAVAVVAILIAALLACIVPALRATRVDPNRLLRSE